MTETFAKTRDAILQSLTDCAPVDPALRNAADFIFVRYILGDEQKQPEIRRFLDELASAQNPDSGALPQLHTFGMALRALNMVGAAPAVPFRFFSTWRDPRALVKLIEDLDWSKPWPSSIEVLHVLTPIAVQRDLDLHGVMSTLESFQSEDGGWGRHPDPHHRLAAAFHFIPIYEALQRTPPRLDRLAKTAANFTFDELTGFLAMDTAYVLRYALAKGAIQYSETEALFRRIKDLISSPGVGYGDRHSHVAAAQLLSILAERRGENLYKDAWDPRLWLLPPVA